MKHIILLGDGMADEPIPMLGGKTPLQAARTPYMDLLAREGRNGLLATIPAGFKPGSEIANLSVLGYDVPKVFEGRGSLEAASMGVPIEPGELVLRCNLITIEDDKIKNHSAGHISNAEAGELIAFLQEKLGSDTVSFYPGVSYRHLIKIKGGNKAISTTPPHDVPGTPFREVLVRAETPEALPTADLLNELILKSQALLASHPVNLKRVQAGKDPANSIWVWSPGYKPKMETFQALYGKNGSVISAVDLIRGIGVYAGLKPILVEGATGLFNTNYEGKAQAAIKALRNDDFVYVHVEAPDEAGHEGNVELKIRTIEDFDSRIVGPIYEAVSAWDEPVAIAVLPDHPTPCRLKTHTNDPIPFLIWRPGIVPDSVEAYDEQSARAGAYGTLKGDQFIQTFFAE
ncbi:MAG: cofactor-independent phosphoglycerate mutase [Rikenellaceae bacterium]|jgi:2,3-bisphosphoglycerate-independent phosphoglycerate mutase|nr:cofactor-independent phosphoglycerate mutase [Rikenellaceae bacterium]